MSKKTEPVLNTKTTAGTVVLSPSVALAVASTTQIPVLINHAITYTAGEQPVNYVQMKDGTVVPMAENLLIQTGGNVKF